MRRTYHPSPMNITPEAINRISVGARLAGMWPYLEEEIENMQKDVTARAMRAMQKGELTPEKALAYWQEYRAATKLLQKFETLIKLGTSEGETNAENLEIE